MDELDLTAKARQAIFHVLGQIRSNPTIGYELGVGSQSFALLTEAYAAIVGETVERVRKHFHCVTAAKAGQADAERLDWLHQRLLELPTVYTDLLGLPKVLTNLRIAIDDARGQRLIPPFYESLLRYGKWTPAAKATVRFLTRPTPPSLAERISAARLTAIRARQWAETEPAGSAFGKRLLAQAEVWEAKAAELTRIQRGRQPSEIPLF